MTQKLYKTDDELKAAIEDYFSTKEAQEKPLTITGLAYHLGFESRQSFYDYEKNGEHSYTIKRARLFIEAGYENKLHGTSPTGAIFALKNFGWVDKQELDATHTIRPEDIGEAFDEAWGDLEDAQEGSE